MIKKVKTAIIIFSMIWISTIAISAEQKAVIEYFFQPGCPECDMVDSFVKPQLEEQFKGKYTIVNFDINKPRNIPALVDYQEKFNISRDEPVSMVVNKRVFLNGYPEIEKKLLKVISEMLDSPGNNSVPEKAAIDSSVKVPESTVRSRFRSFTLPAILTAGFIDGINPCVFAALIFFISLLSVSKIRQRKLLIAGSVYCIACFISYLALGFGLFRFLKLFSGYKDIQTGINYIMAAILIVMAFISFKDAWKFSRSGKAADIDLQLPGKLKEKVHEIMKKGLSYKHLIPGAFFIGVTVTAIESVCTGQVYVPTLVYLSGEQDLHAFFYLILYNTAFIIPLIIIFITAYLGVSTPGLIGWSRQNVTPAKIIMGCFFIAMAFLIVLF